MLTSLIFEHYINKEMEGGLQHEQHFTHLQFTSHH